MNGGCDIVLATDPMASIWDEYRTNVFEFDRAQIATDALIFVVNADNPIDNLTTEQIQKIYTGEITNWSQVGGDDVPIIPFQRNAESGSQAAMLSTAMKGLTMADPPSDYLIGDMAGLIEAVRNYDDSAGAIGYTVYYYANEMKMAEGLKILSVDGVQPDDTTIRAGAYPFLIPLWAVIAKDTPADSPTRVLYNWLQSAEGQTLVSTMGYVSENGGTQ